MAWYYGTFSCGHKGRVNIIGPGKEREWKKERAFEKMCPECWEKHLEEEKEKANALAAEKAKKMELPSLSGSEKQVAWANTLRQEFIDTLDKFLNEESDNWNKYWIKKYRNFIGKKIEDLTIVRDYILENKVEAKYWIDNRGANIKILSKEISNAIKTDEELIAEKQEKEIKLESTVIPKKSITNSVAEITYSQEKIQVKFEKNDEFRELVKELGYKWEGIWERNISITTGSAEDRVAELGNKLLNAGFPIMILDETVRNNAINGTYESECTKWVMKRKDKNALVIKWNGYSDKMYKLAKSLPGARWDNGMLVNISHYVEVEEFANLYGYKFTPSALEAIEKYKEDLNKIEKVNPREVEKIKSKDGLEEILKSNDDILEDLMDD